LKLTIHSNRRREQALDEHVWAGLRVYDEDADGAEIFAEQVMLVVLVVVVVVVVVALLLVVATLLLVTVLLLTPQQRAGATGSATDSLWKRERERRERGVHCVCLRCDHIYIRISAVNPSRNPCCLPCIMLCPLQARPARARRTRWMRFWS